MSAERLSGALSQRVIEDILHRGKLYEVGGVVRDRLLGLPDGGKDRDYLVCGLALDDLTRILRRHGKVDLVGRFFGVIKFTEWVTRGGERDARTFDIAMPRVEKSVGVGHQDFAVDFDPTIPVEVDLLRRDFTINAMAVSLSDNTLIDPTGGRRDLAAHVLRIVTPNSFAEDPLRMLRAAQFVARFNLALDPSAYAGMGECAHLIPTISAERIADELTKLLIRAKLPSAGFRLLQSTGALKKFLPELEACVGVSQPGGYHRWDVFEHTLHVIDAAPPSLGLRLACLFHDINKPQTIVITEKKATFYGHEHLGARTARVVMRRLRFPSDLISEVSTLVQRHMFTTQVSSKGLRRLVSRVGVDLIFDLLELRRADVFGQGMGGTVADVDQFEVDIRAELARKAPFGLRDLALDGGDIMREFTLAAGPLIGRILSHLLERVLENPEDNTRERLTVCASDFLANGAPAPVSRDDFDEPSAEKM